MTRGSLLWWFIFAAVFAVLLPHRASSQIQCAVSDSALTDTLVAKLELAASKFHRFGENDSIWPHEFDLATNDEFKAFRQIFDLRLTDHVSGRFSTPEWEDILNAIMDNDTTTASDDVFGKVWDYFLRPGRDLNTAYAGVRYNPPGGPYTKIYLVLYDTADDTHLEGSFYSGATLTVNASSDESVTYILGAIAHEFQHLCFASNELPRGYQGIDETLSTLAEYFLDAWADIEFNVPYDSSIMDFEPCDIPYPGAPKPQPKYFVYKPWMIYLYEVFLGNPADRTDDLIYRWIRNNAPLSERLYLDTLADLLWTENDFDWLGGVDATDRLNRMYANFLAAKFCNAEDFEADGRFGLGPTNSVTELGFFTDNDGCTPDSSKVPETPIDCPPYENSVNNACWNVRVLAPSYELDIDNENVVTTAADVFADPDASVDSIDVYIYGTDYIVFRAGSYFEDGEEHELSLGISGRAITTGSTKAVQPLGWVIGYSSNDAMLQVHPEHLVFVEPIAFDPASTSGGSVSSGTIVITDFGRAVKAVVVAVGAASLRPDLWDIPVNGFKYEYDYGVVTPGASSRAWSGSVYALGDVTVPDGGTLNIAAGTQIKIWPSDLAGTGADQGLVEFNVEGTLDADGSAEAPIVFKSWNEASDEDWVGFYFDSASDGGTFDHCAISNAVYGIDSYVPVTVTNSEIKSCFYGVFASAGALVQNCNLSDFKWHGIYLQTGGTSTVRNTIVDGADYYGLAKMTQASLVVRNSQFKNSDTGLWIQGSGSASVDSTCSFYGNDTGVHLYGAGSSATIRGSSITNNTSNGILCDNASHPLIDGNMFDVNSVAIYCSQSSSPTVKNSQLQHFNAAVIAASSSNPDLGHDSSTGNNTIGFSNDHGRYVANYTASTIFAQNNCWNVSDTPPCAPPAGKFLGAVDRSQPICCTFGEMMVFHLPKEPSTAGHATTALVDIVPNPFNPTTTIHYSLASQGDVTINIYDAAGRLVEELTRGTQSAGPHSAVWNGTDRRGSPVASGVYFVRMVSSGQVFTRKMLLLK